MFASAQPIGIFSPAIMWSIFISPLIIVLRLNIMLASGAGRTKQPDVPNHLNVHAQSSYRYAQNALRIALRWVSQKATIIETKECPRPNHSRGGSPICLLSSSRTKCKLTTSALGDVTPELSSRPDRSHAPSVHSDHANPITLHLGGLLQRYVSHLLLINCVQPSLRFRTNPLSISNA